MISILQRKQYFLLGKTQTLPARGWDFSRERKGDGSQWDSNSSSSSSYVILFRRRLQPAKLISLSSPLLHHSTLYFSCKILNLLLHSVLNWRSCEECNISVTIAFLLAKFRFNCRAALKLEFHEPQIVWNWTLSSVVLSIFLLMQSIKRC